MKFLRNILDKNNKHFEKGGKLHSFYAAWDAMNTLFFVPNKVTPVKGAHIRDAIDMKRTMITVWFSLIPALLFGMWNIGDQYYLSIGQETGLLDKFWYGLLKMLPLIIVSYGVGLTLEIIFAQVRNHEVNEGYFVTGLLIPMIVPVNIPLWQLALSVIFAVIIGKEVFGGTGMNILNPALTSRAFLFFNFPSQMSGDKVWISGLPSGEGIVDGFSGATPLANAASGAMDKLPSAMEMFIGNIPGSIAETSVLAILIGAAILLFTGIGNWKIMLSFTVGGLAMGFLLNGLSGASDNPYLALPAWQHLMLGGFAFGAVFMATDPVTAAQTEVGKWIYGFLGGLLAILVRVVNPAYPEGVMLAILLVNVFAPLIDYYVVKGNIKRRKKRWKLQTQEA
jgi:Na+-transporting NADH:ubiquinone oxidoreductase subunit B